ncbi:response regulator [Spirochaetia bacterium 38H-sp]|uniref:Response regulator n=1 Tax=Rarispira pelagica TaxID=3141764 RepID=A0ABU9UE27_9SPIR
MYRAIIADDSATIRSIIERTLTRAGIQVLAQAKNGDEALSLFRKQQPNLVTLDITMPGTDGLKCLEEIKKNNPKTEIIIISALSDQSTAIKAIKMGASTFIKKPFTEHELLNHLETLGIIEKGE